MRHSRWADDCGCELSPSCEVHRAALDLGAALQAAVLALSEQIARSDADPAEYFAENSIGREIAAALHKAGLLLLVPPPRLETSHTEELLRGA